MIINRAALHSQSTVLLIMVLLVGAGVYSYLTLPRESDPDIVIPYVFVTTVDEGMAPKDVESLITMPLERKLKGLSGVEEITSLSEDGVSTITIEFIPDVDIDMALQKVREKVDQARNDLPPDLEDDPRVEEENQSESTVVEVTLSGPYSLKRLKSYAEDMQERLETVPGVLRADIAGGLDREILVEFDLDRIAGYGVPFSSLLESVRSGSANTPGGSMDIGDAKYQVRVPGEYEDPREIMNIVAFVHNGNPVYLRDIARIRDHHKDPQSISRLDGNEVVGISVVKRSGANIPAIAEGVKAIVADMSAALPSDLEFVLLNDTSKDVAQMVGDLENNILTGLVLVLVVVFVFIGGRAALFVSLAIPFSMFMAFALLKALGITLNMVVLFSLTLSLGMLVDNGIVIVENIYRYVQQGMPPLHAAREATDEVAWPVITSTLTTVGAFLPIMFWPGIMGKFMVYLPLTVIFCLFASLMVALVINPVLSARYQSPCAARGLGDEEADLADLTGVKRAYKALLSWALRRRLFVVAGAFAALGASVGAFVLLGAGVEFMPDVEPSYADIVIEAPLGTNLDASDRFVRAAEAVALEYPEIKHAFAKTGSGVSNSHLSAIRLEFVDQRDRSRPSSEVIDELRPRLQGIIHGAEVRVDVNDAGPNSGPPVSIEISGDDMEMLGRLAGQFREAIATVPGLVDLKDDFEKNKPELVVRVDKEKAALLGLDTETIASTVRAAVKGEKVGVYREGKDEFDIVARLPRELRDSKESLERLSVSGAGGAPIPLTSVARVEMGSGLGGITRIDQKRVVTIAAEVEGRTANAAIADIKARLRGLPLPRGYSYAFTGEQEEEGKAQAFLGKAFIGAVAIIFLVLVTQFNSFLTPLIILTSVALSLIGVFLGLVITGRPFGVVMTGVGVISLAGVAVNNAIVLIDYANQLKSRGLSPGEALIRAGLVRFRPVMLTALTTLLGLLPMATEVSFDFFHFRFDVGSESSQWWSSMAVAVVFGLAVATLLTLVVVPVLCSLQDSLAAAVARRKRPATKPVPQSTVA
jgi:CzcA family heavy metal efflux pump